MKSSKKITLFDFKATDYSLEYDSLKINNDFVLVLNIGIAQLPLNFVEKKYDFCIEEESKCKKIFKILTLRDEDLINYLECKINKLE